MLRKHGWWGKNQGESCLSSCFKGSGFTFSARIAKEEILIEPWRQLTDCFTGARHFGKKTE